MAGFDLFSRQTKIMFTAGKHKTLANPLTKYLYGLQKCPFEGTLILHSDR